MINRVGFFDCTIFQVHKNWGDRLTSVVEREGVPTLVSIDGALTKDIAKRLANQLLQKARVQTGEADR